MLRKFFIFHHLWRKKINNLTIKNFILIKKLKTINNDPLLIMNTNNRFEIISEIDEGAFGIVLLAKNKET